ncbi:metallophosphoesterase family protein [Parabacteroides sp. OttesenSCG-928-G07]|nr:metallophosphoesterase family protein [Parabacteroides sp. OttesenSCG-928-G21]MDL2278751.1 metallophosphoesterase family protein [Parabacteroides sp. OttesenSCG-928-G07]
MKKACFIFCLTWIPLLIFGQSDIRIMYGPYLQKVSENEATIMWVTDKEAVSWVELAPDDGMHFYATERPQYFQTNFGKKMIGKLHEIKLKNLQPNTNYRYRIYSKAVMEQTPYYIQYGKVAASDVYRGQPFLFRTLDTKKTETTFTMVNDIHADSALLVALMQTQKIKNTDFVLFNGDMLSDLRSEQQIFDGFMTSAVKLFAAEIPMFFARGNHEARGPFSTEFIRYFPTSTGQPYYTFRQGPAFFIVLDAGEDKPDSDIEYLGLGAFDIYRQEQTEWLKKVLESDEFKQAPVKIVVMHVPPVGSSWYGLLQVKEQFLPLLNKAGIDLMLSGHLHRHIYYPKGEEGCEFPVLINSNKHVVTGHVKGESITLEVKDAAGKLVEEIVL